MKTIHIRFIFDENENNYQLQRRYNFMGVKWWTTYMQSHVEIEPTKIKRKNKSKLRDEYIINSVNRPIQNVTIYEHPQILMKYKQIIN